MNFCLFARAVNGMVTEQALAELTENIELISGLTGMSIHHPELHAGDDPCIENQQSPGSVLQCYFDNISYAEAALAEKSFLYDWLSEAGGVDQFFCQIMSVRYYLTSKSPRDNTLTSYLVGYQSQDELSHYWVGEYLKTHPVLLTQLPAVVGVEVYTPVNFYSDYPFVERFIQRNKVVFNSVEELSASLNSPVRKLLREDYQRLPVMDLKSPHYPMRSFIIEVNDI